MAWGFPLALKSKKTGQPLKPKPVNNAREDKFGTASLRDGFARRAAGRRLRHGDRQPIAPPWLMHPCRTNSNG
jgi:hypothetical protein